MPEAFSLNTDDDLGADPAPIAPDDSGGMPAETPDGDDADGIDPSGRTVESAPLDAEQTARAIDVIGAKLADDGVAEDSLGPGLGWLSAAARGAFGPLDAAVPRTDRYNIDAHGFTPDEIAGLNHFLSAMHQCNVPQHDVIKMIAHYQSLRAISAPKPAATARSTPSYSRHADKRIAEIQQLMRSDPRRYYKDEQTQAEYRRLLEERGASR